MNKLFALSFLTFLIAGNTGIAQVKFQYCNFEYSKNMAAETGKPFFIYFTEPGCEACKQMEKSTFKNENTATAVNGNMGSYKAMVNSTTGKKLAEKFSVFKTPTILFFDKDANMIQRVSEPLTAIEMQTVAENPTAYQELKGQFAVLKEEFTVDENGTASTPMPQPATVGFKEEPAPAELEAVEYETAEGNSTTVEYDEPVVFEDAPVEFESEPVTFEEEDFAPAEPEYTAAAETGNLATGKYTIQMGAFRNMKYADRLADDLMNNYEYSVNVREEVLNGKTVHRVYLGNFTDVYSAKEILSIMKNDGRDAFMKKK